MSVVCDEVIGSLGFEHHLFLFGPAAVGAGSDDCDCRGSRVCSFLAQDACDDKARDD